MNCELSWFEQRTFLNLTLEALQQHPVREKVFQELSNLQPMKPVLTGKLNLKK